MMSIMYLSCYVMMVIVVMVIWNALQVFSLTLLIRLLKDVKTLI